MSIRVRDLLMRNLGELRHEPSGKRIRATFGEQTVIDSISAVLVWEPRRVVPSYAVPAADVQGELVPLPQTVSAEPVGVHQPDLSRLPILNPRVPFEVHTTDGQPVGVRAPSGSRTAAAFRPTDPDLAGHVVLSFADFDAWYEEDQQIVSHPRDPFHRVDVLPSSRHVRVELDGQPLAESIRAHLLFETLLPTRYYLPREDVRTDLHPSATRSYCAYKGEASYWSPQVGARVVEDLVWGYEDPLHDAAEVRGLVSFFDERVDLVLDGQARERPRTQWA